MSCYKKSNMLLVAASQIVPGICLSTGNITLLQNINYIAESWLVCIFRGRGGTINPMQRAPCLWHSNSMVVWIISAHSLCILLTYSIFLRFPYFSLKFVARLVNFPTFALRRPLSIHYLFHLLFSPFPRTSTVPKFKLILK